MQWLHEKRLKPAVAERVPLARAAEVHRRIDTAQIAGKLVRVCSQEE